MKVNLLKLSRDFSWEGKRKEEKNAICLSKQDLLLKKQIKAGSAIRKIAQDLKPKVCSAHLGKMIVLSLSL